MERSVSVDEKIRRAEEIYNRRNSINGRRTATVNVASVQNKTKLKKMLIQVLICILIYTIYYLVTTTNYVFSADVINKTKEILNQDINFVEIYNNLVNSNKGNNEEVILENNTTTEVIENSSTEENTNILSEESTNALTEESTVTDDNMITEENTLSASEENVLVEETSSFNQMDIDANEIKSGYSLIKPLSGTITSRYGVRNPTTETVPKYHTGIDIAANEGTIIISAMEGIVSVVSTEGDYRKSYKNIK